MLVQSQSASPISITSSRKVCVTDSCMSAGTEWKYEQCQLSLCLDMLLAAIDK